MPEGKKGCLGVEDGGMGACEELRFGVVEFVDLDVVCWETWSSA